MFDENVNRGLPSHHALICLFDSETGAATAMVDATGITATRTPPPLYDQVARPRGRDGHNNRWRRRPGTDPSPAVAACSRPGRDPDRLRQLRWHGSWRSSTRGRAQSSSQKKGYGRAISSLSARTLERPSSTQWIEPGTHVTSIGYRGPDGELPMTFSTAPACSFRAGSHLTPFRSAALTRRTRPASGTEMGELLQGLAPGRHVATKSRFTSRGDAVRISSPPK